MSVEFPGSPRPTLGVEWEIALVDKSTRDLSNTAAVVFDAVEAERAQPVAQVAPADCVPAARAVGEAVRIEAAVGDLARARAVEEAAEEVLTEADFESVEVEAEPAPAAVEAGAKPA